MKKTIFGFVFIRIVKTFEGEILKVHDGKRRLLVLSIGGNDSVAKNNFVLWIFGSLPFPNHSVFAIDLSSEEVVFFEPSSTLLRGEDLLGGLFESVLHHDVSFYAF